VAVPKVMILEIINKNVVIHVNIAMLKGFKKDFLEQLSI